MRGDLATQQNTVDRQRMDPVTLKKRLLMVSCITTLQFISMMIMRQNAPLYLESIGASELALGSVVAAFALLPLLIALPSGVFMDRIGYRSVILFGSGSMVAASVALAFLPSTPVVLVTQLVAGLANILVILATQAYVSNLGDSSQRTQNFAFWSISFGVGLLAGPPIAGVLEDLWGYAIAFLGAGLVSALVMLISTRLVEVAPAGSVKIRAADLLDVVRREVPQVTRVSASFLRNPVVQLSIGVSVCVLFVITLRASFYLVYLERLNFSSTRIGILVATQEAFALLFRPFLAPMIRRFGAVPLMVGSLVLGGVGMAAVSFSFTFGAQMFAAMLSGLAPAFTQPISMILMSASAPDDLQGTAMGFRQMVNQAPLVVGPLFFGVISTLLGLRAVFIVAGVVLIVGASVLFFARGYVREAVGEF